MADDHTGTNPVVRHAVDCIESSGTHIDEVCCLYATAPFITGKDLQSSRALLRPDIEFVFAATRFGFPVQRALVRGDGGRIEPLFPQWIGARSQDLPEALHDAGQFYWGRPDAFRNHSVLFRGITAAYDLPTYRVQDIDTEDDWIRAERLYQLWKEQRCASPSA